MKTTPDLIPHFQKATGCKVIYYSKPNANPNTGELTDVVFDEQNNTLSLHIDIGKKKMLTEPLDWLETKASGNNTEVFKYRSWYLVMIDAPLGLEVEV